jgi:uncharacterized membrane protein YjjP (DUF1212 family)
MKRMHTVNIYLFGDYAICALVGLMLRFIQDRKKEPRPDFIFQLAASIAVSIVAYFMYPVLKIKIIPEEVWIMIISWLAAFIVTTADYIVKNGIVIYLRKIAEDFLSYTNKKTKL